MVSFEIPENVERVRGLVHGLALNQVRPISRELDEHEHEKPWDLINFMQGMSKGGGMRGMMGGGEGDAKKSGSGTLGTGLRALFGAILAEEMCWGDAGVALSLPGPGLGGAAIQATGTPEQKERFLSRFGGEKPVWGAMAITEAHCGSDTSAIKTTARKDGDHWVLNGEKIFVTSGKMALEGSQGFVVVWATVDAKAGRAGIKPFIVEAGTPGVKVAKVEHKMGIHTSDTAVVVLEDCKIPLTNILGSPEVVNPKTEGGFKGVMATFDASRPFVAAMATGVARASLDFTLDSLEREGVPVRYGESPWNLSAVEKAVMEMESMVKAARLLTWRACWLLDNGQPNNLEAAMAKSKAGQAVTFVTQKAVELLGPVGYSRKVLLEKWMRDGKINDIYEGTGQIQLLIIARRIFGFDRNQLK